MIGLIAIILVKEVTSQLYFPMNRREVDNEELRSSFWTIYNNIYYFNLNKHSHIKENQRQQDEEYYHQHHHHHSQSEAASSDILPPASDQKFINSIGDRNCETEEDIDYIGLISWLSFCVLVLMVGVWAGCVKSKKSEERSQEQMMLAGRDINVGVGVLTMAATWVGGGFLCGAAQVTYFDFPSFGTLSSNLLFTQGVYSRGLIWTQAPIFYSLSLIVG